MSRLMSGLTSGLRDWAMAGPLPGAIGLAYRAWTGSLRYRVQGWEALARTKREQPRILCALWHEELFNLIAFIDKISNLEPKRGFLTMASDSKDGELIARVLERLNFFVARGSSSRGGVKALLGAARRMNNDALDAAMTVDGPRGPRREVKPGVFLLARRTGAWIVPVRARAVRGHVFERAWDKFQLPYPFSVVETHYGEAYPLPAGELTEDFLAEQGRELKGRLDALGASVGEITPGPSAGDLS